jgi:hypothetical protein
VLIAIINIKKNQRTTLTFTVLIPRIYLLHKGLWGKLHKQYIDFLLLNYLFIFWQFIHLRFITGWNKRNMFCISLNEPSDMFLTM